VHTPAVNDPSRPGRVAAARSGSVAAQGRPPSAHGAGQFSDDFNVGRQAYAVMARSPYARAHSPVARTRRGRWRGVVGVYSGADCAAAGSVRFRTIPSPPPGMT